MIEVCLSEKQVYLLVLALVFVGAAGIFLGIRLAAGHWKEILRGQAAYHLRQLTRLKESLEAEGKW